MSSHSAAIGGSADGAPAAITVLVGEPPALHRLHPPGWTRRLSWLLLLLLLGLPPAMYWVPWQQNVTGSGRVVARDPLEREIRIDAPLAGRLDKSFVTEGQSVSKGDVLFQLSDNDPNLLENLKLQRSEAVQRRDAGQEQLNSLTERIGELEKGLEFRVRVADQAIVGAEQTLRAAEQSVIAAEQAVTAATAARETAVLQYNRLRDLKETARNKGLPNPVSDRDFELATLSRDQSVAEVKRAEASVEAARNTVKRAEAGWQGLIADRERVIADTRANIESARASQQSARATLASAQQAITEFDIRINRTSTQQITAPRDGVIVRLLTSEGAYLKDGSPMAVLLPITDVRTVELLMHGNDVPLISRKLRESRETGEPVTVRLQFEGWPAVQFAGWPQVSIGTFRGKVAVVDAIDDGNGKFRILVVEDRDSPTTLNAADTVWPDREFLRQGVRVKGWVLLEEVPLGYEIWRQLNGFPPMIPDGDAKAGNADKSDDGKSDKGPGSRAGKGGK